MLQEEHLRFPRNLTPTPILTMSPYYSFRKGGPEIYRLRKEIWEKYVLALNSDYRIND